MRIRRPMCMCSLIFMLAIWIYTYVCGGVDVSEVMADHTEIMIDGVVDDKAYRNFSNIVYITSSSADSGYGKDRKFVVYLKDQDISDFRIGQTVRVKGSYSNFSAAENYGQFDMRAYYRIRGYEAKLTKAHITHSSNGYSVYKDFLYNIKERTKSVYKDNMSPEHFGTMCAMVLGDKTDLLDETKSLYQNAGISHVLSLSGLHIATIGMFIFSMLIKTGVGTYAASGVSAVVMVSYGIMTGLSTSTFRALIMFFMGIFAKCVGRTYDLLSAVCVSAMIILVENPFYIYDSGFLMSFLSVIGIGVIYPVLNRVTELDGVKKKIKRKKVRIKGAREGRDRVGDTETGVVDEVGDNTRAELCKLDDAWGFIGKIVNGVRQSVCISLSATLATLPVVAGSFYKLSRYSIFLNIVIVPVMSVVLFLGIAGGMTGYSLHKISQLVLKCAEICLNFFSKASDFAGGLPGNTWVIGKPMNVCIVLYVILMIAGFCRKKKLKSKLKEFVITFVIITVAIITISYRKENDASFDILFVGQGACNVIHGKDVPTLMIDAGSTDVKNVGKYRVIPNLLAKGIDEIDYLFVTHPDDDHISAVKELLADKTCGIKVDAVIFSIVDDEIIESFEEYGVPVYSFNAGQTIAGNNYEIHAVYPEYRDGMTWKSADANENSLVLKITHKPSGFSALFTGDIGKQTEGEILQKNDFTSLIGDVSFMTVAHHGSKNSSSEEFILYVNPLITTISAGKDNSYGHPHKETLATLNSHHIPYLITYETGEIDVNINSDKVRIEKFLE